MHPHEATRERRAASLTLQYAARDAEAFCELLLSPTGGAFEPERVCKLVDEDATTRGVTRALRSFLTKPAPEDLVVIYLACHGGADPRRPALPGDRTSSIHDDQAPDPELRSTTDYGRPN